MHAVSVSNRFDVRDKVQVLDTSTGIWEPAVVVGIEGTWSARVKWSAWSWPATVVTVAEFSDPATWSIRKPYEVRDNELRGRRTRSLFTGNASRLTKNQVVSLH